MTKTALSKTVGTETFGKDSKPTIYYVTGYGSTIAHFKPHMLLLNAVGYRVVAFDHDRQLLGSGDPAQLKAACDDILKYIEEDRKMHTTAGLYGISLGTFIVLYISSKTDIRRLALSAGADSFRRVVMEQPRLHVIRQEFKNNGYDEQGLTKAWAGYDVATRGEIFKPDLRKTSQFSESSRIDAEDSLSDGVVVNTTMTAETELIRSYGGSEDARILLKSGKDKTMLVMVSQADDLIKYDAVLENVAAFRAAGAGVVLRHSKKLGHGQVIIRNCFRFIRTARFFKA